MSGRRRSPWRAAVERRSRSPSPTPPESGEKREEHCHEMGRNWNQCGPAHRVTDAEPFIITQAVGPRDEQNSCDN